MDADIDLFVQAFWVKCRETIRPELDASVEGLRGNGHEANVSTLEYSPDTADGSDPAPALVLTVHPKGSSDSQVLTFRGEVARKDIEVTSSVAKPRRYQLADIDSSVAKREIAASFATLLAQSD